MKTLLTILIALFASTAYAQPVRSIIVCPAEFVDECNAAAKEVDTLGGERTFTVPLIPETRAPADPPATAYVTNWQFKDAAARQAFIDALERRGIAGEVRRNDLDRADPAVARPRLGTVLQNEALQRVKAEE